MNAAPATLAMSFGFSQCASTAPANTAIAEARTSASAEPANTVSLLACAFEA